MRKPKCITTAAGLLLLAAACGGSGSITPDAGQTPDSSLVPDGSLTPDGAAPDDAMLVADARVIDVLVPDGTMLISLPPKLMFTEGSGTARTSAAGRTLDTLLGQPMGIPFFLAGQKKVEPGLYPQTRVKP